ncbi:MAG: hypothetical protein GY775_15825, partial [Candidatus Scalindua sp.]|nr:hypothetical protein [Candidatus Scalindua sp.]
MCKKAAKGRIELKQRIKSEALFYCTTTDIWSSRALSAFIGFMIHYLTKEFELVSWNLEVQKFDGKHSGEGICEVLQKLINDWNLIEAIMALMVRDNASSGTLANRLLDVESFEFIAHSLYLVLVPLFFPKRKRRAAIESCDNDIVNAEAMGDFEASLSCNEDVLIETVAEKVEVLRGFAKYFCKSTKGAEKLKLLQSTKPLGCILDVVIRWNSSCYMLERLLLLQP